MAIKHAKRKVAPKKDAAATSDIVVVGNYKARQLDWKTWNTGTRITSSRM